MPRAGWVAAGAVAAALLSAQVQPGVNVAIALVGLAMLTASWAVVSIRSPGSGVEAPRLRTAHAAAASLRFVAIGTLLVAGRLLFAPHDPGLVTSTLPGGSGPWLATIDSIGAPRAGQQPAIVTLDAPAGIRLAATLPGFPVVVPGDRVALKGSLRPPPTDDPYGDYLARIGAAGTIRASQLSIEPATGELARSLEGLRRGADRALRLAVPEPEAGLASGVLIGLRDRVDRDLSAAFTAVGATHVVAISGWNIAIVATTLAALAGRIARRRRVLLTAFAIVAYVIFVGPSPSVVRAAGMAGVVMLARELGRPSRAAAAIGWAVVILLVADPGMIEDIGFQLSALATVGLIAWGTPFSERLAGRAPGRVRSWLAESLGVSLAAQLATLPIVVLSFGRLSLVSPVVNLGVVPLVAPAMGAGVVALGGGLLAMAGLPAGIATVVGLPAWLLFSLMVGVVRAGASLPFASVQLAEPWNAVVATVAGITIGVVTWWTRSRGGVSGRLTAATHGLSGRLTAASHAVTGALRAGTQAMAGSTSAGSTSATTIGIGGRRRVQSPSWWRTRAGRLVAGGLAASIVAMAVVVIQRPDGIPRVSVLDVGQGDAILVEGGRGGRLLIDGGPDPGRLLVALDEYLPPWDRRIDVVILSHPHEDHAAGLAALLDRYAVSRVLEPGMFGPGSGYAALNAALIALGIARGTLSTGDRLTVDEFRFQVLWPDPGTVPQRPSDTGTGINNVSIVLLGEVAGHRLLLAGDIEEQIDPTILARGLPKVDFLKVAHHGSRTASTASFLEAVRPAIAVISAGRGNPYGHPSPATVARLESSGAQVLRTDTSGTVTVDLGPGKVHVRSTGARAAVTAPIGATAVASLPSDPGGRVAAWAYLCAIPLPSLGSVAIAQPAAALPAAAAIPAVAARPVVAASPVAAGTSPGAATTPRAEAATSATPRPNTPAAASATPRPLIAPPSADSAQRLRYDAARDPRPTHRAGRLFLGRRQFRDRRGRRRPPQRRCHVPGRSSGAMARQGRDRRCGANAW